MYENLKEKVEITELYKGIKNLDKDTREVFYFRIKTELSFKEIAQIMGKSEEWARVMFYRGKLKLKEEMSKK